MSDHTLPHFTGLPDDPGDWNSDPEYDAPVQPRHRTAGERDAFHDGRAFTVFWCLLTALIVGPMGWHLHKWVT